jgi:hypothetical protein
MKYDCLLPSRMRLKQLEGENSKLRKVVADLNPRRIYRELGLQLRPP